MANIQQRGDNSWFFTVSLGRGADGKYKRRTKTITVEKKMTPKQLKEFLDFEYAKFKREVEAGEYIAPEKMTFGAFVGEWREKYGRKQLRPTTLEIYLIHLNSRIIPAFGHLRLDEINTFQIVNFIEGLQKADRIDGKGKLSPGTIHYIIRALKNVFSRAVEWKIIKASPANGIKKPRIDRTKIDVYSVEETNQLLTALLDEPPHWRMMIMLALITGMRRGELLGLEWEQVDLEKGTITISQSLSTSKGNRYLIGEPKTKSSVRTISLPGSIVNELKAYKRHCNKERLLVADLWEGGNRFFVFTIMNGKPISPYSVDSYWKNFIKKHELRYIRFHDLRHTSATLLLNNGVQAKHIADRLGHANITTTLQIYAHTVREADQAAADKFENILNIAKSK